MLYWPERVVAGAKAMGEAAGGAAVVICVEDNKRDAIARLEETAGNSGVRVQVLPSRYPQGGERQLIQSVLGREVPAAPCPQAVGCWYPMWPRRRPWPMPWTAALSPIGSSPSPAGWSVRPIWWFQWVRCCPKLLEYSGWMELVPDVGFG